MTVLDNWGNGGGNFTRTIPFDKLQGVKTAAQVQALRDSGQLIESHDKTGFFIGPKSSPSEAESLAKHDPEQFLRALWDAQEVPKEQQATLIAEVTAQAQPGAQVGPFKLRD